MGLTIDNYDKLFINVYMKMQRLQKTQSNLEEESGTLTLPNIKLLLSYSN